MILTLSLLGCVLLAGDAMKRWKSGELEGETGRSDTAAADDTGDRDTGASDDTGSDSGESAAPDRDGDGSPDDEDCNDDDPSIHPGATERCDEVDDDCDGSVGGDQIVSPDKVTRWSSIHEALAAAANGEVILVCPGRYAESLVLDRDVDLRSFGGSTVTTIAAAGSSAILIDGPIEAMVTGFTLTGGTGTGGDSPDTEGGGMAVAGGATVVARDITIVDCTATYGGGLAVVDSQLTLTNGMITGNTAQVGGGVLVLSALVELEDATISENEATGDAAAGRFALGGGVCLSDGELALRGSTLTANLAGSTAVHGYGAGLYVNGTSSLVGGSVVDNLAVNGNGGGLFLDQATVDVTSMSFTGNTAEDAEMDNQGDVQAGHGGGMYANSGAGTLHGVTISGNAATWRGGAGYLVGDARIDLTDGCEIEAYTAAVDIYGEAFRIRDGTLTSVGTTWRSDAPDAIAVATDTAGEVFLGVEDLPADPLACATSDPAGCSTRAK